VAVAAPSGLRKECGLEGSQRDIIDPDAVRTATVQTELGIFEIGVIDRGMDTRAN
jgi:hypothetical protein